MKISRAWLQKYFEVPLPEGQALADAFTFHSFEVDEQEGDLLDLKVLPDRAGYALCHRGVARELSAALDLPLKSDPLRQPLKEYPRSQALAVSVDDSKTCARYMGALVKDVKVGPSPAWLKEALESVGQRSINNIVDATNYVMLDLGQPLHAFDAGKLRQTDGGWKILVRSAPTAGKLMTLDGVDRTIPEGTLLIVDENNDQGLGIAGIKGGKAAEVDVSTTDLIIEAANFDGPTIRKAAQKLKLFTDASLRFQNRPSPELAAYGMDAVLALIVQIAGGEVEGVVDVYPEPVAPQPVSISLTRLNELLGASFTSEEVGGAFERLGLATKVSGETFAVTPPFERTDIIIPEDLVEEAGRILGYERLPAAQLPPLVGEPDQARFRGIERMKDQLVEQGFIEVSTQAFVKKGDITLANPLDQQRPALRTSLNETLEEALAQARHYALLVLAPGEKLKLFEVGAVFPEEGEYTELRMTEAPAAWGKDFPTVDNLSKANLEEYGKDYAPKRYELGPFQPFSLYPFIVRDVAVWVPADADAHEVEALIKQTADELCTRIALFDRFAKEGRVSLAYRLIFQSFERTLTDEEANAAMERVYAALKGQGFEIR